jgi:hypothetical protein
MRQDGLMRRLLIVVLLSPAAVQATAPVRVDARMENVLFHLGNGVELHVRTLTGQLVGAASGAPPVFDDLNSYTVEIESARVSITPESLTSLIDGSDLRQTGVLRKGIDIPFDMRATIAAAPDGRIRIHPTSLKAAGFVSKRVLDFFGLGLRRLVKPPPGSAMTVEGDDLVLDQQLVLPPPRIRGRVTRAWIADGVVFEQIGAAAPRHAVTPPDRRFRNYMYYRGGTLRFGKLTMTDADLMLVDDDPSDPFDFSPSQYNDQLMAGYSKNTASHGLITHMPDLDDLMQRRLARSSRE